MAHRRSVLEIVMAPNTQKAQDATHFPPPCPFKFPIRRVTEKELEGMGLADGPQAPFSPINMEEDISKWLRQNPKHTVETLHLNSLQKHNAESPTSFLELKAN